MHVEGTILFSSKFSTYKENERDGTLFDKTKGGWVEFFLFKKKEIRNVFCS
jgi:hypothetical protein